MEKRWSDAILEIMGDGHPARYRLRVRGRSMSPSLLPGDEVIVEQISLEALQLGDLILLQNGGRPFLHRFLGVQQRDGQRWLLSGGDQNRHVDPPWPEAALCGRAKAMRRGEESLPLPTGRWYAWRLRLWTALWTGASRLRLILGFALLLLLLTVQTGWASVTLVSFNAEWAADQLHVTWETASEINNIGFYVLRSDQEGGDYQRVTELIPSEGDIMGAAYEWIDSDVDPGKVYYYKLEDLSASGGSTFTDPVPLSMDATATSTPTPEPTATFTLTPEPTATDTPLPSSTPTPTPEPLPSLTPTLSPTDTPLPSPTPIATPVVLPTATSTAPVTSTNLPTVGPSATASTIPLQPTATSTQTPAPEPSTTPGPAPATPLPLLTSPADPTPTAQPSPIPLPTGTEVTMLLGQPSEGDSAAVEQSESASRADEGAEEEFAQAKRRLTWSLIGIGGAIGGVLLLISLALIVFALYQWGFLRSG